LCLYRLDAENIAATNIAHIAILCCLRLLRLKRPLMADMLRPLSPASLWLTALVAVPAPEILRIWTGVFRPRDGQVGMGVAARTSFHLAVQWGNPLR
jgi:hypothetical protein